MQLVEGGKIDLDAIVQTYLPDFTLADPDATSRITVRQLLNQTSGLSDAGFPAMRLPQPDTPAERVAGLHTARQVAQPGSEYHYYNVNYEILARLVEVASGESYSEYLQAHIFGPLQMADTISALTSTEAAERATNLAQGHLNFYGIPVASPEEKGYFGGSGGIVSTAEDMAHYLVMQASGGRYAETALLSPAGVERMHTPPPDVDSDYAMGWIATSSGNQPVLEHNGILSTFYADMALLPESGCGIVLLYNIQSVAQASLAFPQIKSGLIEILNGETPQTSWLSSRLLEAAFALLTLAGTALAVRSLRRLPGWAERARRVPLWRLAPGIVWAFVPAALVVAMPDIVLRTSGRAFGYLTIFRSMPEVITWLGLTGILGVVDGVARIALLARRADR
jgi:CubicO group peptidase (beta-lactamase class C family)